MGMKYTRVDVVLCIHSTLVILSVLKNNSPNTDTGDVKVRYKKVKESSSLQSFLSAHLEVKALILPDIPFICLYIL
jgi:hypothetical protein